jgi:hypothetical protein
LFVDASDAVLAGLPGRSANAKLSADHKGATLADADRKLTRAV